jgi:hypothetical protein
MGVLVPAFTRPRLTKVVKARTLGSSWRAMRAGGVDAGAPALITRIHPNYFAGFVKDPDGHHVEFVCHAAE